MLKEEAILTNNPIGMNSAVLKIKAEMVIPISGSHSFIFVHCLFIIQYCCFSGAKLLSYTILHKYGKIIHIWVNLSLYTLLSALNKRRIFTANI